MSNRIFIPVTLSENHLVVYIPEDEIKRFVVLDDGCTRIEFYPVDNPDLIVLEHPRKILSDFELVAKEGFNKTLG